MNLPLDTHLMLWAMQGRAALPKTALPWIDGADVIYVSAASVWEAAVKVALGKLRADVAALGKRLDLAGFVEMPIRWAHAVHVAAMPMHHRDPFDRLLVAQAVSQPVRLLTCDPVLARYSDLVTVL